MVTVPFGSFFYAKQLLVEPTIYSMITVLLNAGMLYYMVTHPGDWLIFSAFWTCLLGVSPEIVKMIRAFYLFPECRFYAKYLWSWTRTKALLNYAGWMMFGALGAISKNQLLAILVNKQYGPNVTAAVSVANHVSGNLTIFSGGMINAFQPAIVNACGAKDFTRMRKLAFMTCKFGTMLIVFFALPVALELPKIMQVWLKTPPKYTVELCWFILAMVVIDKTTVGHQLAINANGKIALYQAVLGSSGLDLSACLVADRLWHRRIFSGNLSGYNDGVLCLGKGFFCSLSGRYVDWLLVEKNYASAVSYDYSQWGRWFFAATGHARFSVADICDRSMYGNCSYNADMAVSV